MKRDMDLMHKILERIEEHKSAGQTVAHLLRDIDRPHVATDSPHTEEKMQYHVDMLARENLLFMNQHGEYRLTWYGHDYLEYTVRGKKQSADDGEEDTSSDDG